MREVRIDGVIVVQWLRQTVDHPASGVRRLFLVDTIVFAMSGTVGGGGRDELGLREVALGLKSAAKSVPDNQHSSVVAVTRRAVM